MQSVISKRIGFGFVFYNCNNTHGGKPHLKCVIVFRLQKLILRNNSTSTTQHLRLLIRGQDQDCFQVCRVLGSVLFYVLSDPEHLAMQTIVCSLKSVCHWYVLFLLLLCFMQWLFLNCSFSTLLVQKSD